MPGLAMLGGAVALGQETGGVRWPASSARAASAADRAPRTTSAAPGFRIDGVRPTAATRLREPTPVSPALRPACCRGPGADGRRLAPERASPGAPGEGRAFLYSLVLPGAGQHALGQRRWMAYAAVELGAAALYLDRRWSGHDLRDRYRELAWAVARDGRGPAVVDDFEYYERLTTWGSSGSWDTDPNAPGLQPETDPGTFNGSIWRQARELFFGPDPGSVGPGDPAWERALQYYETRAYGPDLVWDWSDDPEARERYADLLDDSDDDLRTATNMLGILLANHLVSAADAFLSARARDASDDRVDMRLRLDAPPRASASASGSFPGALGTDPFGLRGTRLSLALAVRP